MPARPRLQSRGRGKASAPTAHKPQQGPGAALSQGTASEPRSPPCPSAPHPAPAVPAGQAGPGLPLGQPNHRHPLSLSLSPGLHSLVVLQGALLREGPQRNAALAAASPGLRGVKAEGQPRPQVPTAPAAFVAGSLGTAPRRGLEAREVLPIPRVSLRGRRRHSCRRSRRRRPARSRPARSRFLPQLGAGRVAARGCPAAAAGGPGGPAVQRRGERAPRRPGSLGAEGGRQVSGLGLRPAVERRVPDTACRARSGASEAPSRGCSPGRGKGKKWLQ